MKDLSRRERWAYYTGILAAWRSHVDINDLVHIDSLLLAEEKGLLLKLPCKVGDKVFKIYDKVYEFKVTGIYLYDDKEIMTIQSKELQMEITMDMNDFCEVCFLTKKEAKKALAEMER